MADNNRSRTVGATMSVFVVATMPRYTVLVRTADRSDMKVWP